MKLDKWAWIFCFFHASMELNGSQATEAANLVTGENRPEPDEDEMIALLKPVLAHVHKEVGCKDCRPSMQPQITKN